MAHVLDMADQIALPASWKRGGSQRRIARETGVHRETVDRYIRPAVEAERPGDGSKPAISTAGSEGKNQPNPPPGSPASKSAVSTLGSAGWRSLCDPLREIIQAKLETGLSATRIWQELISENGFPGGYRSVIRFVWWLEVAAPLPCRRMECNPGDEAQVDFGTAAPIVAPDGTRRRMHVFRIVLSNSRKAYSEIVWQGAQCRSVLPAHFFAHRGLTWDVGLDPNKAGVAGSGLLSDRSLQ